MELFPMSRIFKTIENVYNAVDAVIEHGYAAVDGTKSSADPYCERIRKALSVYPKIAAQASYLNVDHQGYLYFVYDLNRFDHDSVKPMITAIDEQSVSK